MKLPTSNHIILSLFLALCLMGCGSGYIISSEKVSSQVITEEDSVDDDILTFLEPYSTQLGESMDEVIGVSSVEMPKAKPESLMGNFLTDIVQYKATKMSNRPVDFSVLNYGGLRLPSIPGGPITTRTIFELLPFENFVTIVEMNAEELNMFLAHISKIGPWPVSKELECILNPSDASLKSILINNNEIDPNQTYRVAMPDYIANGGDNCKFLIDLPREETGALLRDIVISYIKSRQHEGPITSQIEGRVRYE